MPKYEHRLSGAFSAKMLGVENSSRRTQTLVWRWNVSQVFFIRLFEVRLFYVRNSALAQDFASSDDKLPPHSPGNDGNVLLV